MIPTKWKEVTIEQFVELQAALEEKPKTDLEIVNNKILQAVILSGLTVEEVEELSLDELENVNRLLNSNLPQRIRKSFKLNGIRYKVIFDAKKLNGSRYIAVMNSAKRGTLKSLHQVMYSISQPTKFGFRSKFPFIGYKDYEFKAHEVEGRINDFKSLTIDIANPVSVFFSNLSKCLTKVLDDSLLKQTRKMTQMTNELTKDLTEDMAGL